MRRYIKYIFGITAAVIILAVVLLILTKHKPPPQSFTTEVSVKSGTVEVQSPEGTALLKAGEMSVVESGKRPVKIEKPAPKARSIETFSISGRVEDDKGSFLVGAILKLYESSKPNEVILQTASDVRGEFTIEDVKPDRIYTLTAEERYCFPAKIENIDTGTDDLVIVLERGAVISGKVVSTDNQPINNATITAPMYANDDKKNRYYTRPDVPATTSAEDGTFELTRLKDIFVYDLKVTAEGYVEALKS